MVKNHWDAFDPAFAFNEGGDGTPDWLGSQGRHVSRRGFREARDLAAADRVHGKAGHGSMPNANNPNLILINALHRLLEEPPPISI